MTDRHVNASGGLLMDDWRTGGSDGTPLVLLKS